MQIKAISKNELMLVALGDDVVTLRCVCAGTETQNIVCVFMKETFYPDENRCVDWFLALLNGFLDESMGLRWLVRAIPKWIGVDGAGVRVSGFACAVLDLKTTTSQKCAGVPRRART